ncbi:MAG: 2-C-methyl-D-erythritol 4-phosphate cytidylyltransferase [Gemmatimonadota bacterium]|jgi:2-C-methyl-D-erythritol 4-phosphate cytidylyltransferase|nr:2-C-methyl-D-erythritol 4-phosphate cytidylyltransferase [Gemmatimonadota bacterium]
MSPLSDNQRVAAVVVAAGSGRRLGGGTPKQYRPLAGVPVLLRALRPFLDHPLIERVVVVLPPDDAASPPDWLAALPLSCVAGGAERTDSVRRGLAAVDPEFAIVLVHDGARPLVSPELIDRVIEAARQHPSAAIVPGERVTDTIKEVDADGRVVRSVPREELRRIQTPQAFPALILRRFHDRAREESFSPTDDAGLFERYGAPVRLVDGDPENLKVTTPVDLLIAEALMASRGSGGRMEKNSGEAGEAGAGRDPELRNILFVCTGNTCRSPMAEVVARRAIEKRGWRNVHVSSAGVAALPGSPASAGAIRAVEMMGLDLSGHRARLVDSSLLEEADLILTMSPAHLEMLRKFGARGKSALLGEFAGGGASVPDPFGGNLDTYRTTLAELARLVTGSLDRIANTSNL